jgi:sodium-coupled monocarboxylate transporter 8/12
MNQLVPIDYLVVGLYMTAVIGLGVVAGRRNCNATDLLLAGRSMNWLAVAASMYASFFSAISFLAMPAESFRHDWQYATGMLMMPVAAIVAGFLFVEFFYRLGLFTVFQYTRMRFNNSVRVMLVVLFLLGKSLHAGLVVFGGSLAISIATGQPLELVILLIGATAIIYTSFGGLRAVIWTDVLQLFVMSGAILITLVYAVKDLDGGVGDVFRIGAEHGKFSFVGADFSLTARLTLPGVLIGAFAAWMSQKGIDQVNAQLYLSGRSPRQARRSLMLAPFISIVIGSLLYLLGTTFWVYYQQHPDSYVEQFVANGQQDRILPYFVVQALPAGIRGLVMAGLFAAAMSTLDSLLNALATTTLVDLYRGCTGARPGPRAEAMLARAFMVFWGVLITLFAAQVIPALGESMIGISNRIIGLAGGPALGVFLLGMFSRRASSAGVIAGAVAGFILLLAIFFAGESNESLKISFTLYAAIGIFVSVVVGYCASLLIPSKDRQQSSGLLWLDVVWRAWRRESSEATSANELHRSANPNPST